MENKKIVIGIIAVFIVIVSGIFAFAYGCSNPYKEWIENELLFGNVDTRLTMDFDSGMTYQQEVIKKNGLIIDTSYVDAKEKALQSADRYSVSYKTSADFYDYTPINKTVRVKCYIRTYGTVVNLPYISNISIRKYGEDSLWINRF